MLFNCNKKNDWNQVEQSWVESSKKGTSGKEAFDSRQFKANWASECVFGRGQSSICCEQHKASEMHCRGKRGVEHSATSFLYSQQSQCYNE